MGDFRYVEKAVMAFLDSDTKVIGPFVIANMGSEVTLRMYGEVILRRNGVNMYAGVGTLPELRELAASVCDGVMWHYGWEVHGHGGEWEIHSLSEIGRERGGGYVRELEILQSKPHILPVLSAVPEFIIVDGTKLTAEEKIAKKLPHRHWESEFILENERGISVEVGLLSEKTKEPSRANIRLSAIARPEENRFQGKSVSEVSQILIQQIGLEVFQDPKAKKYLQTLHRQGRTLNPYVARTVENWPW